MDGFIQFKRFWEDGVKHQWGAPGDLDYFKKKIKEFNKTHNVELRVWGGFRNITIYVDARRKHARNDKWIMIASKYLRGSIFEPKPRKYVNLKNLTEKNRNELKDFVPEIEQYFRGE